MNKEVKTLGYLLTHYTKYQCYDQYVPLKWLENIRNKLESNHKDLMYRDALFDLFDVIKTEIKKEE
jgi:hypothetical protein